MAKSGKVEKGFTKDGQNFSKDEVVPVLGYAMQYPVPPSFERYQVQCKVSKGGKEIEVTPDDVKVLDP